MRSDMDKVIVERPRYGSRSPSRKKGYRKYVQSMPADELPLSEPMLGRWKGRDKWLNEHLGPMRRGRYACEALKMPQGISGTSGWNVKLEH